MTSDAPEELLVRTRARAGEAPDRTFALRHRLGLRALPALAAEPLDAGSTVHAEVTVGHLLECRREIAQWVEGPTGAKLVLALRGPLTFSEEDLARIAPKVTPNQLEMAVALLLRWEKQAPQRVEASFETSFVGLTPSTTVAGLRAHLDGLRRHGLKVDPLRALDVEGGPPAFRLGDARLAAIVAEVRAQEGQGDALAQIEEALAAATTLPRPKGRRLRLLPASPEKGERRGHVRVVELGSRGAERRTDRERAALAIRAVRAAAHEGGTTLVVSGAEPTREWYLDDLVALARSLGFARVVLETNAVALAEPGRAKSLAESGLTDARVALPSFDATLSDAISGVAGALAQTMQGVQFLLDEGIAVELAVALLPANAGELTRIVEEAPSKFRASRAKIERVVVRVAPAGPGLGASLPIADAARVLVEGARASLRSGLALATAPGGELPPCVFESVEEASSVLRLSEGVVKDAGASSLYTRIALCEGCGAKEVCPGPRRELAHEVAALGRRVPAFARGLPEAGERKRVLRELLSVLPESRHDGTSGEQRVLRVNFHCNQACTFCFVSRELPAPEASLIEAEIAEAARRGSALSLSGGEPTLNPRLLAYIARATELGIERLDLQTNAIKMSDAAYASALAGAGLKTAFVSLHGTTAATCDRVTVAPGTFVKTVQGIKNLLAAGVLARLNFVLCAQNAAEFAEWPDFVAREFLGIANANVQINFSFAAALTDNVPRDTALLPRFSDVAWALQAALDRADALGIPLLGFDSQCGVPPCFLPVRIRDAFFTHDLPEGAIRDFSTAFRKGEACADCALSPRCYGVRTAYAEMYGTSELRAIARTAPNA